MTVKLILNADDFGTSAQVNEAVAQARAQGLLTSASLMITGRSACEAVKIAKADGALAVGLHLTLSNGRSCLPPSNIPLLVDAEGRFPDSPALAAMRYYFHGRAATQLRREIEAQFEAFRRTELRLDHVDGHQHLHLHPAVFPIVLELAVGYRASGIRIPKEPLISSACIDRNDLFRKAVVASGHAYLRSGPCRRVARAGLSSCEITIGSLTSGRISPNYLKAMLRGVRCNSVEAFFHPSVADTSARYGPNRGDLDTLLDPRLASFLLHEEKYELASYSEMQNKETACDLA